MYYIVESEGLRERWLFRLYQNACMAALELAQRTPHEVRVVRLATSAGLGRQIMCVYNCKYKDGGGSCERLHINLASGDGLDNPRCKVSFPASPPEGRHRAGWYGDAVQKFPFQLLNGFVWSILSGGSHTTQR
jgi:hypothetical protein